MADKHDRKPRHDAASGEFFYFFCNLGLNRRSYSNTVQYTSRVCHPEVNRIANWQSGSCIDASSIENVAEKNTSRGT
jgi:hypothetical protein